MQLEAEQTVTEISDYFKSRETPTLSEVEILGTIVSGLLNNGYPVSNKAIIEGLLRQLEQESNVSNQQGCRNLLELVLLSTQDDVI
ncbi:biofilm/acid-resistance regulator YmgB/AriR [Rahnella bonaserana]|jgi:probable RcsB/C two-component-system connector, global regulator of biofilm formation and acid-resistance|uniref:Biofilm development protein AriR n=1 Tax=Rahnella bonaserana TaxID=2816248 RepID=A0ABS6LV93_9GAMM|nr:biofilm/acid-resistance regulator YmgB/AriR [Rahnella bonaserana]MBU9855670.1 biofilm development protein AriR [Rahnella bonaserana]WHZ42519.1 biofilm/acid-resistance regulator YmgB/AriR [Rahnella bonaserana]